MGRWTTSMTVMAGLCALLLFCELSGASGLPALTEPYREMCIGGTCLRIPRTVNGVARTQYVEQKIASLGNASGYIVEFKKEPVSVREKQLKDKAEKMKYGVAAKARIQPSRELAKQYREQLQEEHRVFEQDLSAAKGPQKVRLVQKGAAAQSPDSRLKHYFTVFNGAAVKGRLSDNELAAILTLDYVKNIHPDRPKEMQVTESLPIINATGLHLMNDSAGHNITGWNITIAIIDTGIDYTHQDLGNCTEAQFLIGNCTKIIGGYDFVNNDNNPMDDNGHGTHVAGIAAGNGSVLKGVAPDALLYAYKVLDSSGSGYDSDIIAAIERAADPNNDSNTSDHIDIISMSLGGSGDPFDAMSTAVNNAVDLGILAVIAAGNSGPENGTVGCPGCAAKALTVGALYKEAESSGTYARIISINDSNQSISANPLEYSNTTGTAGITAELLHADLGYPENFSSQNFTGRIALIKRGALFFYEKVNNAIAANASGAIIYNNEAGNFLGTLVSQSSLPAASISKSDGEYFLNISANGTVSVKLTVAGSTVIIADFSSRGPMYMYNKPDIMAPGVLICSSRLPGAYGDSLCLDNYHAAISGTSMATPMVAGSAALIMQSHRDWSPMQVKAAITATATDLGEDQNAQGAGRINVLRAANLSTAPPVAFLNSITPVGFRYE